MNTDKKSNRTSRINITIISVFVFLGIFALAGNSRAEVIFEDNYDTPGAASTCADGVRAGYTESGLCSSDIYNSVTHYGSEISSGGITGNSLKFWRRNGGYTEYNGGWLKALTMEEFAKHYKELYIQWYVKIPADWNATIDGIETITHKLDRINFGSSAGNNTDEIYSDIKGPTFKTGKFSFGLASRLGEPVYYTAQTVTQLGINNGQWHSLEWHLKLSSATGATDGGFAFYVDGTEVLISDADYVYNATYGKWGINMGNYTNEYFTGCLPPGIGNLTAATWNFTTSDWHAFEFDDYVVSTTRIGISGGGGDTTPPATPSGLAVS